MRARYEPAATTACGAWIAVAALAGVLAVGHAHASGESVPLAPFDLPAGATVTLTFDVDVDDPLGNCAVQIVNQGTVTATGVSVLTDDPTFDGPTKPTRTPLDVADLAVSKTNGVAVETPGTPVTYTIVASNAGPIGASATVEDVFPAAVSGVTWSCTGDGGATCVASGSGNIAEPVTLPPGGSVTFVASGLLPAAATGTLTNTARVTPAPNQTDCNPSNNIATDTDSLQRLADLAITKTDGATTVAAGSTTVYTLVASNAGPSDATGATVSDPFPTACTSVSWSCSGAAGSGCPASGSGNINRVVDLPAGASVSFLAACTIDANATGTLSNTATVGAGGGTLESHPMNNSATDASAIEPLFRNGFEAVAPTQPATGPWR